MEEDTGWQELLRTPSPLNPSQKKSKILIKRAQTHIFLCLLAYHLLVCIEKMFLDRGVPTSCGTIREKLSTHQTVTIVLPTDTGKVLHIRKGSTPEKEHKKIYDLLKIPYEIMKPKKWWSKE